jgi:transcriptional regulator with XRE-family HTH domain
MDINLRIRKYIKKNGMSFTFVANRAGFDIKKFSRFMSNKQLMTTDEYEKVCKDGLRVDPTLFFKDEVLESKNVS